MEDGELDETTMNEPERRGSKRNQSVLDDDDFEETLSIQPPPVATKKRKRHHKKRKTGKEEKKKKRHRRPDEPREQREKVKESYNREVKLDRDFEKRRNYDDIPPLISRVQDPADARPRRDYPARTNDRLPRVPDPRPDRGKHHNYKPHPERDYVPRADDRIRGSGNYSSRVPPLKSQSDHPRQHLPKSRDEDGYRERIVIRRDEGKPKPLIVRQYDNDDYERNRWRDRGLRDDRGPRDDKGSRDDRGKHIRSVSSSVVVGSVSSNASHSSARRSDSAINESHRKRINDHINDTNGQKKSSNRQVVESSSRRSSPNKPKRPSENDTKSMEEDDESEDSSDSSESSASEKEVIEMAKRVRRKKKRSLKKRKRKIEEKTPPEEIQEEEISSEEDEGDVSSSAEESNVSEGSEELESDSENSLEEDEDEDLEEDAESSEEESGSNNEAENVEMEEDEEENSDEHLDVDEYEDPETSLLDSDLGGNELASPEKSPEPELPFYHPAIQGCRSVDEFQCLNRIEEGTYGVVYRAKDKKTGLVTEADTLKNLVTAGGVAWKLFHPLDAAEWKADLEVLCLRDTRQESNYRCSVFAKPEEIVALKRLKMEKEREGFPITSLREVSTLLKAHHANCVRVQEIVVGSNVDKIYIVMDYVEHDLKSLMETMKQPFLVGEVKTLMIQLLRGVHHLHDNWILHRDLKTSNLLLSHRGILKIGDFGLAREYGSPLKPYTPIVVTLWYRSPELLLGTKEYSIAVDNWSVGCIFAELLSKKPLFPGKSEIMQLNLIFKELGTPSEKIWPGYNELPIVKKTTFTEYPYNTLRKRFGATDISEKGFDLLNRFLTYCPERRVTSVAALSHDWFLETPKPVEPSMFPTWPAKSEQTKNKRVVGSAGGTPKAPEGAMGYNKLLNEEEKLGFQLTAPKHGLSKHGMGFSLKF